VFPRILSDDKETLGYTCERGVRVYYLQCFVIHHAKVVES
jgi:hypothetical protein